MKHQPMLSTNRLQLRPVELGDAAFFMELMNTPKWLEYIGDREVKNLIVAKKYLQDNLLVEPTKQTNIQYVVQLIDGLDPIGICGLYDRVGIEGKDIGFAFLPQYEGQGYATEAAQRLLLFGFHTLDLTIISAITTKENHATQKFLIKLGFESRGSIILSTDTEELLLYRINSSIRNIFS